MHTEKGPIMVSSGLHRDCWPENETERVACGFGPKRLEMLFSRHAAGGLMRFCGRQWRN